MFSALLSALQRSVATPGTSEPPRLFTSVMSVIVQEAAYAIARLTQ